MNDDALTVAKPESAHERPAVLIVDDLPEKLLVLQTVLDGLDTDLVLAHSGGEALREMLKREFAVVLLDVNMPDIEPRQVGTYDDTQLRAIDQLMLEARERGIKLVIAMHDRYQLGCWGNGMDFFELDQSFYGH